MSKIPYTGKSPLARQTTRQPAVPGEPDENLSSEHPLLEDPNALADRLSESEEFVRRNKTVVFGLLGAILLVIVGGIGYYYWRTTQNDKAQAAMFQAVNYWEADSLKKALKGDGQYDGLEAIAAEYGSTKAGNLANFYAGSAALKSGDFKAAIDYLEDFSSDDLLLQARAYCLIGDANMELKQYKEAADYYQKAADYKSNEFFTPAYLMKLAVARELNKDFSGAAEAYDKIVSDYPTSAEANEAKIRKGEAQAQAGTAK